MVIINSDTSVNETDKSPYLESLFKGKEYWQQFILYDIIFLNFKMKIYSVDFEVMLIQGFT